MTNLKTVWQDPACLSVTHTRLTLREKIAQLSGRIVSERQLKSELEGMMKGHFGYPVWVSIEMNTALRSVTLTDTWAETPDQTAEVVRELQEALYGLDVCPNPNQSP